MKEYLPLYERYSLFDGIARQQITPLLTCLGAKVISFSKGSTIFRQDDPARFFGVVLSGSVQVIRGDIYGSHTITALIEAGDIFGETFACASAAAIPANVIASSESTILLLEHARVVCTCSKGCAAHARLITNLLRIIADKNLLLNQKLEFVMQRTTRDKLMAYLHSQASKARSNHFSIPFDRQGLADYLGVERSAMSTELNKLKKAGVIDFQKNEFELKSI